MWREFIFCFIFLLGTVESAELSGKLIKKYYDAPSIVKNPAFAWFIELDTASKDYIQSLYRQLDAENARIYSDFALDIVQLTALGCEELEQCHVLEGRQISVIGKVENPPHIFRAIRCYQLDSIDRLCALSLVQAPSTLPISNTSAFLIVEEGHGKTLVNPESYGIDIHNLSDIPLEYAEEHPEKPISLRGKLTFRLYPGPPEYGSVENGDYPEYGWFLQMDRSSFQIASTTLLPGQALSPADIMSHSNWYEMQLSLLSSDDFCCKYVNQDVVVEGYLFHAHTGHHHAPFLMDVSTVAACINENGRSMEEHPKYLYKILSLDDWKKGGDNMHLSLGDSEFIHFSTEEQLPKIIDKYWRDVLEFMILKVDTHKLAGNLVFEANPGGTTKYYHLYQGYIPRNAVVEATTIRH